MTRPYLMPMKTSLSDELRQIETRWAAAQDEFDAASADVELAVARRDSGISTDPDEVPHAVKKSQAALCEFVTAWGQYMATLIDHPTRTTNRNP